MLSDAGDAGDERRISSAMAAQGLRLLITVFTCVFLYVHLPGYFPDLHCRTNFWIKIIYTTGAARQDNFPTTWPNPPPDAGKRPQSAAGAIREKKAPREENT